MFNLLVVLLLTQFAQACPLGKGEEQLTIQRVMRNFGRFVLVADMNALKGINPDEKVSTVQIKKGIDDLGLAISCAQAVIAKPEGALLPSCTEALSGQVREDYVAAYVRLMKGFEAAMIEYQNLYKKILTHPESERNFEAVYRQSQKIEQLVEMAHKELFGN